jgi:hypothetical protein
MEKKLVNFNTNEYNKVLSFANRDLDRFNKIIAFINNDELIKIDVTIEALLALWENPSEFIFDVLNQGKELSFNGIPVNKRKAMDLIEFPTNYKSLIKLVNETRSDFESNPTHGNPGDPIDRLTFEDIEIESGKAVLSETYLNEIKDNASTFAVGEKQNKVYDQLVVLNASIRELCKLGVFIKSNVDLDSAGFTQGGEDLHFDPVRVLRRFRN